MVDVFRIVAAKLLVNGLVEIRQELLIHLVTIVFQQCSIYFLVECLVPCVAVIVESNILFLWLVFRTFNANAIVHLHGSCCQLISPHEGLTEQCHCFGKPHSFAIEVLHQVKVKFPIKEARRSLILLNTLLELCLLRNQSCRVDTLVHSNRVFPIVAALRIF